MKRLLAALFIGILLIVALGSCGAGNGGRTSAEGGIPGRQLRARIVARLDNPTHHGQSPREFCTRRPVSAAAGSGESLVSLLADPAAVPPEGKLLVRIVNSSEKELAYGFQPFVDRLTALGWRPQIFEHHGVPVGFPDAQYRLATGKTSPCMEIPVSDTWVPGVYRVRFKVESVHSTGGASAYWPTAYFRVVKHGHGG